MNNVKQIQLQIKAFNKALSRADKADSISDNVYAAISDLIGYDRMTKSGAGKAGEKYLSSMSPKELMAYSSDIEAARNLLKLDKIISEFDIGEYSDTKSLLWKLHDELIAKALPFDSNQVRDVAEGYVDISPEELIVQMYKYKNDPTYGSADVYEWFQAKKGLE